MQQSNKILLIRNLEKYLNKIGLNNNLNNYEYIIKIDKSDTKELSGNMEQILNFWVLPMNINQKLRHRRVFDILVSGGNEIPMWIGIEVINQQIQLTICKRFKKLKVVEQWHGKNETIPFVDKVKLKSTKYSREFHFAYPASMFENQKINCDELQEIVNVLNLGIPDFVKIQELIWQNVENSNADILKLESKDNEGEFVLIDLWNCDKINVMNCYFKTVGANIDFVYRSLYRWNDRLWKDLGPKVKEIDNIEEQEFVKGRNIVKFETENAV